MALVCKKSVYQLWGLDSGINNQDTMLSSCSDGIPPQASLDVPLTAVEAEVIKLYKEAASETKNDPLYVRCTAEHRGVGDGDGMVMASCLFSFKIHRDVSKERRTQILQCLFDDMTGRVDEAFSVAGGSAGL
jgi:hypothetical protein